MPFGQSQRPGDQWEREKRTCSLLEREPTFVITMGANGPALETTTIKEKMKTYFILFFFVKSSAFYKLKATNSRNTITTLYGLHSDIFSKLCHLDLEPDWISVIEIVCEYIRTNKNQKD